MAEQLIVDLYGCAPELLNDPAFVGISYIAVITTSHFSIHTWPEYGYAAVDIFSCSAGVPQETAKALGNAFGAAESRIRRLERDLKGGHAN